MLKSFTETRHDLIYGLTRQDESVEVVRLCLQYFFDRLNDGGSAGWPEIEYLGQNAGLTDGELKEVFKGLGFDVLSGDR